LPRVLLALNASLDSSVSAVSTISEVSSAPADVSSPSMGTGQQQAEGALSSFFSSIDTAANGEQVKDAVSVVCSAHERSRTQTGEADRRRNQVVLTARACSALDKKRLVIDASLGLRHTKPSAAAQCVTALNVGGLGARHIHNPHSCQNHPAGLWSTADGNGVCSSEAAGRSPVTDSRKGHPHPSNCLPAHSAGADFAQLRSAPAAIAPIDPSNCPPARVSLLTSPRDRASEASRSQGEKRAEGPGASGWERSPED
jgi:hypothetical protein